MEGAKEESPMPNSECALYLVGLVGALNPKLQSAIKASIITPVESLNPFGEIIVPPTLLELVTCFCFSF
jgi:hypothetical protein